jgi:hypothetical protein
MWDANFCDGVKVIPWFLLKGKPNNISFIDTKFLETFLARDTQQQIIHW